MQTQARRIGTKNRINGKFYNIIMSRIRHVTVSIHSTRVQLTLNFENVSQGQLLSSQVHIFCIKYIHKSLHKGKENENYYIILNKKFKNSKGTRSIILKGI